LEDIPTLQGFPVILPQIDERRKPLAAVFKKNRRAAKDFLRRAL